MKSVFRRLKSCWSWHDLNPFNWSNREIKFFLLSFLSLMLPIYLFIGLQPSIPAEAASYPTLEINSISLKTPVAPLVITNQQLYAPDTLAGAYSQSENKTFIIGHSSTVFKKLDQVHVDDTLTYSNKIYRIVELKTLQKADISMTEILQAESEDTIILMTCAGEPLPERDATHRLIITAKYVSDASSD